MLRPPSATPQPGPAHQYHLPSSTVGQARMKRKRNIASATVVCHRQLRNLKPVATPPCSTPRCSTGDADTNVLTGTNRAFPSCCATGSQVSLSSAPSAPPAPVAAPVRKLTRKVQHNTCKKCGQFRTAETGHSHTRALYTAPL